MGWGEDGCFDIKSGRGSRDWDLPSYSVDELTGIGEQKWSFYTFFNTFDSLFYISLLSSLVLSSGTSSCFSYTI